MKTIFTFILASLLISVNAQNFYFSPTETIEKTIGVNDISDLNIDIMRNESVDTLFLEYELISNSLPDTWYQGYCDNHGCWGSLPESGTMSPMYDELNSYIRLSINPNLIEGSGVVEYFVYETNHYEEGMLMTFIVHTSGFVGTHEVQISDLKYYPNPAIDFINIESNQIISEIKIYELTGKLISQQAYLDSRNIHLELQDYNSGIYLMEVNYSSGLKETRRLIKK